MDINGFSHDEFFGFGGYKQLPNSNTSFMNFGVEDSPEYKTALNKHTSLMEDLINDADKKTENDRFNKEVTALRITHGGKQINDGLGKMGKILSDIGYKPKTTSSTTKITSDQNNNHPNHKTWVWIIVGVVIAGGAAFAIYKYTK